MINIFSCKYAIENKDNTLIAHKINHCETGDKKLCVLRIPEKKQFIFTEGGVVLYYLYKIYIKRNYNVVRIRLNVLRKH